MNRNTYEENKELKSNILGIANDFPEYSQLWLITRLDNEVNETGKLPEPELLERLNNCLSSLNESDEVTKKIDMLSFKDMTRILNLWEEKVIRPIENQPITNIAIEYPDFSYEIIELNDEIKLAIIDIDNVEKFCSFYGLENHCPEGLDNYYENNMDFKIYALLDKENKKQSVILNEDYDGLHDGIIRFKVVPNLFDVPDNIKNYDIDSLIASINPGRQIYSLKEDGIIATAPNITGFDFFELQKINKILEGDNQIEKFKAIKNANSDFTYEVKELDNGLKTVTLDDKSTKLYNLIANGVELPEEDKDINDKTWNPEKHLFFIINDKNEALATMETSWYGIDTEIDSVVRHSDKDKENVDRTLFNHLADLSDEGYIRNLRNMINENDVCQFDNSLNFYQVLAEGHMDEKEREQERKEEEESHAIRM